MIKIQFHGIDVIGVIKIQRVTTLPVWTSNDIGRVVYTLDTDKYWAGGATEWESLLGADPVSTLPAWTTADKGHIVYDESTGKYYGGGLTAWRSLSDVDVLSTKPVWAATDEGRIIYTTDDNKFYGGNDSSWKPLGGADYVATIPAWAATDEGRIIYVDDENKYYGGNDSSWKPLGGADLLSTIPAWAATDEGRIIYVDDENKYYGGNNEKWASLGGSEQLVTLPTWNSGYTGSIIYAIDEDRYYFGSSTGWVELGETIDIVAVSDLYAMKNTRYICDTLTPSAGFTITLPLTPLIGDFVEVVDAVSGFETYSVTVSSGDNNINGIDENLVLNVNDVTVSFIYSGDINTGWFIDIGGNVNFSTGITLASNEFTGTQTMPAIKLTTGISASNQMLISNDIYGNTVWTPEILEQSIVGRITGGDVDDLSASQVASIISSQIAQIKGVSASVDSNALTLGTDVMTLDFRSATLTSGTPISHIEVPALSLIVPSGATLGTVNAIKAMLVLIVLYNAGTPALGIVNIGGGVNLDETKLLSTTAISDAADLSTAVYSTNAITDSPFRVVGYIEITEATAGTWVTGPTKLQGYGGETIGSLNSIGYGQTWQEVTRAAGTPYYNDTGKPIMVNVYIITDTNNVEGKTDITINGVVFKLVVCGGSAVNQTSTTGSTIIPVGAVYSFTDTNLASRITHELR